LNTGLAFPDPSTPRRQVMYWFAAIITTPFAGVAASPDHSNLPYLGLCPRRPRCLPARSSWSSRCWRCNLSPQPAGYVLLSPKLALHFQTSPRILGPTRPNPTQTITKPILPAPSSTLLPLPPAFLITPAPFNLH